ncbi:MAG: insulinase family protein [Proteobacteria bacterium]|nr:insulinase family protein [Pseudomonadota bacterium]MBU4471759.1 insulinase family protein [Pseudomonadota bacterium]MCG2750540.1 insulinase family protein [Desulfobacteraceae bacterium]
MNEQADPNNPGLTQGVSMGNHEIQKVIHLKEIRAILYCLIHRPTGARHIHISNQDTENTFSVAFKTIPGDSTGVAHILEHTALCGSKNYPVRDPFFSMIKRSLNTFMNAFTASDWTMYPYCSQNEKDFYNLMEVYLDAAFFPLLDELSFKQEGHRLELEGPARDEQLVYKGVVYNEMKGAMSSPNQVMARSLMNALYPDTTYRYNSGGDPEEIPALTHEQLKAFHARFYHPANAFFYTYGNLPLQNHLSIIEEKVLKQFSALDPESEVPAQKRWQEPKTFRFTYPLSEKEDPAKKNQVCLAWLTADINDAVNVLGMTLLENILLGNAGSPLRKALIDSGLGSALSDGTGFDRDNRDTLFACGLKDVAESEALKIQDLILGVLTDLQKNGIEKDLIESAIHQMELHRKEVTNAPYPYGLQLLLIFAGSWFHGGNPEGVIQFDENIAHIRHELAQGPYFEELIRRFLLENPHRVLMKLVPDSTMEKRETDRVTRELACLQKTLTPETVEKIKKDQMALEQLQDGKEDLSCLPTLEIDDIPPKVRRVAASGLGKEPVTVYSLPTSGLLYFSSVIGMEGMDQALFPLIPFFSYVFSKMGTADHDYVAMAKAMSAYTGGVHMAAHARTGYVAPHGCMPFFSLSGKCLNRNTDKLFDIIKELIGRCDMADLDRLKALLLQYRSGLEAGVVQAGHQLAMSLAARFFSKAALLSEQWHGIHQLRYIKKITEDLSRESLENISKQLGSLGENLFTGSNVQIALVGDEDAVSHAIPLAELVFSGANPAGKKDSFSGLTLDTKVPREGWSTTSAVSFVAQSFRTAGMLHEDGPVLFVLSKLLRALYLHREIREKGGAYGGMAVYNFEEGIFSVGSYRDPHIVQTLNVFEGILEFIKTGAFDAGNIKEAILQGCSEIDRPDAPGASGQKAFFRKIVGLSDEARQTFKEGVLSVTPERVLGVAEKYFETDKNKRGVAVISGEAQLKNANEKLDSPLELHLI